MDGKRYYFEDFVPGTTVELPGPTLTREDIIDYARRFDPQPFHVDEEAAKRSAFGGLIASGWHTVALCMRLICDAYLLEAASLGSPGVKGLQWIRPVRPGDTIRLRMIVLETQASRSKPDRGVVLHRWEVFNQRNECVMTMEGYGMFLRRDPAATT